MNLTLSKRGDYVMRSAIALARAYGAPTPRKIREIVLDTEVPPTFASQILADLVRAGVAHSKAGRDGGYRLSRPPEHISVLQIIEASEGPLHAERCALGEGPCRWEAVCPLHETWTKAAGAVRELLAGTSLADVAARDAAIEAGTYAVPTDSHRTHPVTVTVSDAVQVELPASEVHLALAQISGSLGRLVPAESSGGSASAPGRRRSIEPASADASLVLVGRGSADADDQVKYLLSWRMLDTDSTFEAELTVHPVDPERSECTVEGTWRRAPGATPDAPELKAVATQTLRAFLRRLASWLEHPESARPRRTPDRAALSDGHDRAPSAGRS